MKQSTINKLALFVIASTSLTVYTERKHGNALLKAASAPTLTTIEHADLASNISDGKYVEIALSADEKTAGFAATVMVP